MQHTEVTENNTIENYLLHQLDDEAETAFEEHLLICEICRAELQVMKAIIENVKVAADHDEGSILKNSPLKNSRIIFLAAAATILVLAGLFVLRFYLNEPDKSDINEQQIVSSEKVDSSSYNNDVQSKSTNPIKETKSQSDVDKNLIAENFKPNSIYEEAMRSGLRSTGIEVTSPVNDINFKQGDAILFKWKTSDSDDLLLTIFNYKARLIKEIKVGNTDRFQLADTLQPGLYYWQLETSEDLMHTGKFIIQPNQ